MTVSDDFAGTDLQCPKCGRLVTVPAPMDLADMNEDGTYRVDALPEATIDDPERIAELERTFSKGRVDAMGREIDLRSHAKPMDYQRVGVDPIDLTSDMPGKVIPPKYDPETGELIRPMELSKDPVVAPGSRIRQARSMPKMARRRQAVQRLDSVDPIGLVSQLFKFNNLLVIGIIVGAFFALGIIGAVPVFGYYIVSLGGFALNVLVQAHLGNVVDETGPTSNDELPRPLRNLGWSEDIAGPFFRVILAIAYCYWPLLCLVETSLPSGALLLVGAGLFVAGTIALPAVLLTTLTSGNIVNLRPDRVINTIRVIGPVYFVALVSLIVSAPIYYIGFYATIAWMRGNVVLDVGNGVPTITRAASATGPAKLLNEGAIAWPLLIVGLITMHYTAWLLGRCYRVYHRNFPWLHQGRHLDDEDESGKQGFAVTPVAVAPEPEPSAATPLRAIPLDEPTNAQY